MRVKDLLLATLIPAFLLATSCAVEPETETYASQDRVMKAWIRYNYPGTSTYSGTSLYVLDMQPGEGPAVTDSSYVWVHYVKRTLDGDILSTNQQKLAERMYRNFPGIFPRDRVRWRRKDSMMISFLDFICDLSFLSIPLNISIYTRFPFFAIGKTGNPQGSNKKRTAPAALGFGASWANTWDN